MALTMIVTPILYIFLAESITTWPRADFLVHLAMNVYVLSTLPFWNTGTQNKIDLNLNGVAVACLVFLAFNSLYFSARSGSLAQTDEQKRNARCTSRIPPLRTKVHMDEDGAVKCSAKWVYLV